MEVGSDNKYHDLQPWDIIGWGGNGVKGHVGVYVGKADYKFVDVNGENQAVRGLSSYGPQKLYKMSY